MASIQEHTVRVARANGIFTNDLVETKRQRYMHVIDQTKMPLETE
ncbi:MAG: hypothetical protein AB7V39_20685 [Nitrospiraceae bacterium]